MEYVGRAGDEASSCFLCDLAARSDESVVERAELTLTCLNRFPYTSGHLLVAPLRHVGDLTLIDDAEGLALFSATQRAIRAITAVMAPDGFNVGVNHGAAAGASMEHLHLHVVPRWAGDTNFMPVLADAKVLPEHLERTAEKLRHAFRDG